MNACRPLRLLLRGVVAALLILTLNGWCASALLAGTAIQPETRLHQTVAAVEALEGFASAQRVGDVLVAQVRLSFGPTGGARCAWAGYDLLTRQLIWLTSHPSPHWSAWQLPGSGGGVLNGKLVFWGEDDERSGLCILEVETGTARSFLPSIAAQVVRETDAVPMAHGELEVAVDLAGGQVFVASPSCFRAASSQTGKLLWEVRPPWPTGPAAYYPYPTGNYVYFYSLLGRVVAVDVDEGRITWSRDLLGIHARAEEPYQAEAPVEPPRVAIVDEKLLLPLECTLYALNRETGQSVWQADLRPVPQEYHYNINIHGAPVAWGPIIVVVLRQYFGTAPDQLVAVDAGTGNEVWRYALGQLTKEITFNQVASNLLVSGEELLFCTADGVLRALGNDERGEHWQLRLVPEARLPHGGFGASLYQVGRQVVVFNGHEVWWVDVRRR